MRPSISVIVPVKNAGNGFEKLLSKIRRQDYDGEIELVVVDSGSSDGTARIARSEADVFVDVPPEDFHHGRTRNRGAERASGDILVFTVQDALPTTGTWLDELVAPILSGDASVTYGNQVAHSGAKPMDSFFYMYFYPDEDVVLHPDTNRTETELYLGNIFISDACAAVAKDVWEQVRFDESTNMSEDKLFAKHVLESGHRIRYVANARIYHSHDYSLGSLFERRYRDGKAYSRIATSGEDRFLEDGIRYFVNEIVFLVLEGHVLWVPYALLYSLTYFISFTLGKHHQSLPERIDAHVAS